MWDQSDWNSDEDLILCRTRVSHEFIRHSASYSKPYQSAAYASPPVTCASEGQSASTPPRNELKMVKVQSPNRSIVKSASKKCAIVLVAIVGFLRRPSTSLGNTKKSGDVKVGGHPEEEGDPGVALDRSDTLARPPEIDPKPDQQVDRTERGCTQHELSEPRSLHLGYKEAIPTNVTSNSLLQIHSREKYLGNRRVRNKFLKYQPEVYFDNF